MGFHVWGREFLWLLSMDGDGGGEGEWKSFASMRLNLIMLYYRSEDSKKERRVVRIARQV